MKRRSESRFSRIRCAPYGEIDDGDIILLKEVAGPICGLALAAAYLVLAISAPSQSTASAIASGGHPR